MFHKILVAFDCCEIGKNVFEQALSLAKLKEGKEILIAQTGLSSVTKK